MKFSCPAMLLLMPLFSSGCNVQNEPTVKEMISAINTRLFANAEWIGDNTKKEKSGFISVRRIEKKKDCIQDYNNKEYFSCPVTVHFTRIDHMGRYYEYTELIELKMYNQNGKWFSDKSVLSVLHAVVINKELQ